MSLLQEGYRLCYRQMVAQLHFNKEYVSFTAVSIMFVLVHHLYLLPSYIPSGK